MRIKKILLSIAIIGIFIAASQVTHSCKSALTSSDTTNTPEVMNTLTPEEKDSGWILMFDGKTTSGWRGYNKETFPNSGWVVDDGALRCTGSGKGEAGGAGGDIIFNTRFKDFNFKFEWKVDTGGNSGVFYLAQELSGEPIWKSAPEYQILDNERHPDAGLGIAGNRQAGSLYDLVAAAPQNAKPALEWNAGEIKVYRGTIVHFMNGEQVLECHIDTPEWKEMVSQSKFSESPEFGKYVEGYIGLQDHGNNVWYRNMKIQPL